MKFKNRHNECIETKDGRLIWLSRSVAVAVSVMVLVEKEPHILVNLRGTGVPDAQGLWNLPCGYLDYDETTAEAAIREVWEECGVNLLQLQEGATVEFLSKPWDINSEPTNSKQNVTVHHGLLTELPQLPSVSNVNNEPNETADIRWLPLDEVQQLAFAFNHQGRIRKYIEHLAVCTEFDFTPRVAHLGLAG